MKRGLNSEVDKFITTSYQHDSEYHHSRFQRSSDYNIYSLTIT